MSVSFCSLNGWNFNFELGFTETQPAKGAKSGKVKKNFRLQLSKAMFTQNTMSACSAAMSHARAYQKKYIFCVFFCPANRWRCPPAARFKIGPHTIWKLSMIYMYISVFDCLCECIVFSNSHNSTGVASRLPASISNNFPAYHLEGKRLATLQCPF